MNDTPNPLVSNQEAQWISLSDLMTSLMMIFMLIAIAYMVKVQSEAAKIQSIAIVYEQTRHALYDDLHAEFHEDLPRWGAEIEKDLTVRFKEPSVLFATGKDELKPEFRAILEEFFPRYLAIISSPKYKDSIAEIRIEGHTSSFWKTQSTPQEAYFNNMQLSQSRTRSTLQFILNQPAAHNELKWLHKTLTANGLSSSHPILDATGKEDPVRSQRVEFRIRTDADSRIATMLRAAE